MITVTINGKPEQLDIAPDMPLLWAIRDVAGLTGTKYGCGKGLCGACTIHLDGNAVRSCITPARAADNKDITTIEGLSDDGTHPVQQAWIAEQAPQCGYCQSGQIMSAVAFLENNPQPTDEQIWAGMNNLCRCGTYQRIFRAIKTASGKQEAIS